MLDENLFEIDVDEIYGTQVLLTILGGGIVYERAAQGNEDVEGSMRREIR